jgi:hypothetical protein
VACEQTEGTAIEWSGERDVERRSLQRGQNGVAMRLHEPQPVLAKHTRVVAKRARDAQDEVVTRLVSEEKRVRDGQELGRIVESTNVQTSIVVAEVCMIS